MKRKIHLLLALGLFCYLVGCAKMFSPESITAHTTAENSAKESSEANILSENQVETDDDESHDTKKDMTAESGNVVTINASDPWILEKPPTLIVSTEYNADSVTAEL